jgi:hypothetical protein
MGPELDTGARGRAAPRGGARADGLHSAFGRSLLIHTRSLLTHTRSLLNAVMTDCILLSAGHVYNFQFSFN